jgi:1-phosphatidylinositol-4-phosphate 5-kinase
LRTPRSDRAPHTAPRARAFAAMAPDDARADDRPAAPSRSSERARAPANDASKRANAFQGLKLIGNVNKLARNAVDDAAGALTRGFSFTRRRFSKQLKRLNVGRASRRTKQMRRLWTKVHRGNRLGTADGDVLTNHLGLCLQLAFTAQRRGASGDDGGDGEAVEEAVKREVYAVKKMEMANGETLPNFSYAVEAPKAFEELRSLWGMDARSYRSAFAIPELKVVFDDVQIKNDEIRGNMRTDTGKLETTSTSLRVISQALASGKSRSWFFCSEDGTLLVKTCNVAEKQTLLKMLPEYTEYVRENSTVSMLPQFYGLYTIEFAGTRPLSFIVMNYWFASTKIIHKRFDLKGSSFGRRASARELNKGSACIYKDNDFGEEDAVHTRHSQNICDVLKKDSEFLAKRNLLDYSLVFGEYQAMTPAEIFEAHKAFEEFETKHVDWKDQRAAAVAVAESDEGKSDINSSADGDGVSEHSEEFLMLEKASMFTPFLQDVTRLNQLRMVNKPKGAVFCGIIDILTEWGPKKKLERFFTSQICCGRDVSCQRPDVYAKRFSAFMKQNVFLPTIKPAIEDEDIGFTLTER